MSEVRNNGVPLIEQAPKAAITQSILELAAHFTVGGSTKDSGEADESGGKREKTPLWRNLFSGKK